MDFYIDFTQEKFIDDYEEMEHAGGEQTEKLYSIESAHYVLCFLLDLVQFLFQFMVIAEDISP